VGGEVVFKETPPEGTLFCFTTKPLRSWKGTPPRTQEDPKRGGKLKKDPEPPGG